MFLLIRKMYLNGRKIISLKRRYAEYPKLLLKFLGILFIILCFSCFVVSGIFLSLSRNPH
jgi:hypothetical protein